jgi:hypothetical protein
MSLRTRRHWNSRFPPPLWSKVQRERKSRMQPKPILRTVTIVVAALFAVGTPIVQWLTGTIAVGESNLVNDGAQTLEAAGYAFSIWSLIYLGLLAYAVYQALPSTKETPGLRMLGWPSVIAMAGCGAWLIAATLDAKWATVAIIVVSAAVLCVPLAKRYPVQRVAEFWLVAAPLSMLAGWLTVASAINALTVLTGEGSITTETAPTWAAGGILLVLSIGAGIAAASKNWIYPLPIAWGLAAVAVAEQADRPMIAVLAVAAVVALLGVVIWVGTHRSLLLPLPRQQ